MLDGSIALDKARLPMTTRLGYRIRVEDVTAWRSFRKGVACKYPNEIFTQQPILLGALN